MNYLCPLPGALRKCGLARVFEAVRLFSAKLRHFLWSAKKSGEKVRDGVEDLALVFLFGHECSGGKEFEGSGAF